MKNKTTISVLVFIIAVFATAATAMGILSNDGAGEYKYQSIRGNTVLIYGKGLYKDMSAEVAPQGIAQDYVTLCLGIPLLIGSLLRARMGSTIGKYLLAGTLGYFLVTYLFYTAMGMYNALFLVYVVLMGASFFAFILTLLSFPARELQTSFTKTTPYKATGGFLIFSTVAIALLWLSIVVPPLLNGTIIPVQVEHYTTLIVQGLDLGILLPAAFLCGVLWIKRTPLGLLLAPVYFVFLSLLMTALHAKVIAMAILGYNVIPAIFVIPAFHLVTVICTRVILKNIRPSSPSVIRKNYEEAVYGS